MKKLAIAGIIALIVCIGLSLTLVGRDEAGHDHVTDRDEDGIPQHHVKRVGIDPRGRRIIVDFARSDRLIVVDLAQESMQLVDAGRFCDWSPDGNRVLYAGTHGRQVALFELDLRTGRSNRFSWFPKNAIWAKWSPRGKLLAIHSLVDEPRLGMRLSVAESDGRKLRPIATWDFIYPNDITWSPDSKYIYFSGFRRRGEGERVIAKANLESGEVATLVEGGTITLRLSADGARLFYYDHTDVWAHLCMLNTRTLETARIADPPGRLKSLHYACCSDGSELLVPDVEGHLWHIEVDGGVSTLVAENGGYPLWLSGHRQGFVYLSGQVVDGRIRWVLYLKTGVARKAKLIAEL